MTKNELEEENNKYLNIIENLTSIIKEKNERISELEDKIKENNNKAELEVKKLIEYNRQV